MTRQTINVLVLVALFAWFGNSLGQDRCEDRVALRALKSFYPLVNKTIPVKLEVTDVVDSYLKVANYTEDISKIVTDLTKETAAGNSECEQMFYWPDKFLCLMDDNTNASRAAFECDTIGYNVYKPVQRKRDLNLLKKLAADGITKVVSIADSSGRSLFGGDGEFMMPLPRATKDQIIGVEHFPISISLVNDSRSQPQLHASSSADSNGTMPNDVRVLCEKEPAFHERGNPIQTAYGLTMNEFLTSVRYIIPKLRNQFKVKTFNDSIDVGYQGLKLRLNGKQRKVLRNSYILSGAWNWRQKEVVSSLLTVLEDLESLPLSNDGAEYQIQTKNVKNIKTALNVKNTDYIDSSLGFEVERVVEESSRYYAYGIITSRLAYYDKALRQYGLLPYNRLGRIVDERYLYEWDGDYFVSHINVEHDQNCEHHVCDLTKFLDTRSERDKSCGSFLMNEGGREINCRYKEHPWPVAYGVSCPENVTRVVSSEEPIEIRVNCGGMRNKLVWFPAGESHFNSNCGLEYNGETLLQNGIGNGPSVFPESYVDPEEGDVTSQVLYSAIALLIAFISVGTYSACRIFRNLPFFCCNTCCGKRCNNGKGRDLDDIGDDNISLASFTRTCNTQRTLKMVGNPKLGSAPPHYLDPYRRVGGSEPSGGVGYAQGRPMMRTRDLGTSMGLPQDRDLSTEDEQHREPLVDGQDLLGGRVEDHTSCMRENRHVCNVCNH